MLPAKPLLRSAQPQPQPQPQPQAAPKGSAHVTTLMKQVTEALSDPQLLNTIIDAIEQGAPPEQVVAEAVLKAVHAAVSAAQEAGVQLPAAVMQRVVPTAVKAMVSGLVGAKVIPEQEAPRLTQAAMQAGKAMFAEMMQAPEGG